jgi:hypothetical protein
MHARDEARAILDVAQRFAASAVDSRLHLVVQADRLPAPLARSSPPPASLPAFVAAVPRPVRVPSG